MKRSVTIQIEDATNTNVNVNYGYTTGGSWGENGGPTSGTVIQPDSPQTYVNGANDTFTALGGTIVLNPATAGMITITWAWPGNGALVVGQTNSGLTGLAVIANTVNPNSNNPTFTVIVIASSAVAQMVSQKSRSAK